MTELFSPNMLNTFNKCPKKYFFRYIKNFSMPVNEDIYTLGKNIHALASYYLKGENIENMEKALSSKEYEVWQYLKNIEYFKYPFINSEYNLSVKIGANFFGGRLDALVKNEDTYYILDYKTGSAPKNAMYNFQTMIYLLSVSSFFETDNVVFVYIDLKNKCEVKINLSSELISEYKTKLSDIASKIEKCDYTALKNDCNTCEYGKICYDKLLD